MLLERLLRDVVEPGENRVVKCNRVGADLVVAFVVRKEEEFVLFDRPSKAAPILPAHEKWIEGTCTRLRCRVKTEHVLRQTVWSPLGGSFVAREGRHIVVAEEEETPSVKRVGAGSRDNVYCAGRHGSGRKVEGQCADLELLNGFGGKILGGAACDAVVDPRAVNRNHRHALGSAADRDLEEVIDVAGA